jgi:hypothetical protein
LQVNFPLLFLVTEVTKKLCGSTGLSSAPAVLHGVLPVDSEKRLAINVVKKKSFKSSLMLQDYPLHQLSSVVFFLL